MQREELAVGFAIHETATIATVWPALPCFNNLVVFDQLKRVGRLDTIAPELAESLVRTWLASEFEGGRSVAKLAKVAAADRKSADA